MFNNHLLNEPHTHNGTLQLVCGKKM